MLNVRVAAPPWDRAKDSWADVNPGVASSYIFNQSQEIRLQSLDLMVNFSSMILKQRCLYIGGGAGMAPMRSHLYELFKTIKTGRKVSYWYGGRSRAELFYIHYFRDLEKEFPNFKFYMVLSDALQ